MRKIVCKSRSLLPMHCRRDRMSLSSMRKRKVINFHFGLNFFKGIIFSNLPIRSVRKCKKWHMREWTFKILFGYLKIKFIYITAIFSKYVVHWLNLDLQFVIWREKSRSHVYARKVELPLIFLFKLQSVVLGLVN